MKRDRANDIAHSGEKVGQRQTPIQKRPASLTSGAFLLVGTSLNLTVIPMGLALTRWLQAAP